MRVEGVVEVGVNVVPPLRTPPAAPLYIPYRAKIKYLKH